MDRFKMAKMCGYAFTAGEHLERRATLHDMCESFTTR